MQKKICLLGAFGVGKTSLVRRYVSSLFSDAYLTTVGVKVDKKLMTIGTQEIALILWDIAGEDEVSAVRVSYLRGAAAFLLVVDGTRPETLETAQSIQARVFAEVGPIPFFVLLNKADLEPEWRLPAARMDALASAGWTFRRTSAKTGDGVEAAFEDLAALFAK
ncbi:MAG: Rab family GTPase, partial [Burkholderiaceae bacterium]